MSAKPEPGTRVSVEGCYRDLERGGTERAAAEHLLARRHWIHALADFDERTGEMLPGPLEEVCLRLRRSSERGPAAGLRDRLYRIIEHVQGPLREILRQLQERLVREHAWLPVRAVRELDSASFFALSRRPGRTVREKLADRPYLWAVERRWTVDSAENRLVKTLCGRLVDLLRARAECWPSTDEVWLDDLRSVLESWLQGPAAREIGRWENLPPNNLLLQHRNYRRVWDAWLWMQSLDADLQRDHDARLTQWATVAFWSLVAGLESDPDVRLLAQPSYPDYKRFSIGTGRATGAVVARIEGLIGEPSHGRGGYRAFRLDLDEHSRLTLRPPDGKEVVIECEAVGQGVRVRIGARTSTVEMSLKTAADFADGASSTVFGVRRPASADSPLSPTRAAPAAGSICVVDLCALRPRFAEPDRHGTLPFRLLWQRCVDGQPFPLIFDHGGRGDGVAERSGAGAVATAW